MAQTKPYSGDRLYDAQEQPVVKSQTRAKQGVTNQGVRYVLAWGLAAVIFAFVVAYIITAAGH